MKILSQELAGEIYNCHAEIARAKELLENIEDYLTEPKKSPLQDVFGQGHEKLQLGIPSGPSSRALIQVRPELGKLIVIAHIDDMKAKLIKLHECVYA